MNIASADHPKGVADPAMTKPVSRSLFHYTSSSGLLGILASQTLFATHYQFSNDQSECGEIEKLVVPIFKAELELIVPQLVKAGALRNDHVETHGTGVYALEATNLFRAFVQAADDIAPYFITSFCEHSPDTSEYEHGLLSQWRGYARGGFAIEFDELALDELVKAEYSRYAYSGFSTGLVEYDDHDKRAQPDRFKGAAKVVMRNFLRRSSNVDYTKILGTDDLEPYLTPFVTTVPFLKNPGFKEEREFRIVMLCNRRPGEGADDARGIKTIKFKQGSGGRIIPYIELFQGVPAKLPIKSVIIGPHPDQNSQQHALELFIEQNKILADVRKSGLPFRE